MAKIQGIKSIPVFDTILRESNALFAQAPGFGVPVSVMAAARSDVAKELDDLATEFVAKITLKGTEL